MDGITTYVQRLKSFSRNAKLYLANTLLTGVGTSVQFIFFNLYVLNLGHSQDFIGVLIAVQSVVAAAASLAASKIADPFGHKYSIVVGSSVSVLSLLGMTLKNDQPSLVIFSILMGCGNALVWVVGAPFMTENSTEEERTHLFGVQAATMTVSGILGSLVGGYLPKLMNAGLGIELESIMVYRGTLWAAVAVGIFAIFPILLMRAKEEIPGQCDQPLWRPCCRFRVIAKLLIPPAFITIGTGLIIPYFNIFFTGRFHTSAALLGGLFAASSAVTTVGSLASPALAERIGKIRAATWTQLLAVPFLLLMGFWMFLPGVVAGYLLRATLLTAGGPAYSSFLMEQLTEGERVPTSGLLSMVRSGSYALAAWSSGVIQKGYGFGPVFALAAIAYIGGAIAMYFFFAKVERREAPDQIVNAA